MKSKQPLMSYLDLIRKTLREEDQNISVPSLYVFIFCSNIEIYNYPSFAMRSLMALLSAS